MNPRFRRTYNYSHGWRSETEFDTHTCYESSFINPHDTDSYMNDHSCYQKPTQEDEILEKQAKEGHWEEECRIRNENGIWSSDFRSMIKQIKRHEVPSANFYQDGFNHCLLHNFSVSEPRQAAYSHEHDFIYPPLSGTAKSLTPDIVEKEQKSHIEERLKNAESIKSHLQRQADYCKTNKWNRFCLFGKGKEIGKEAEELMSHLESYIANTKKNTG